jgi:hypothetical protein
VVQKRCVTHLLRHGRIGTLNSVDGVPTEETTQMVYDHLDFLRGVEVFLNFIPATSMERTRLGPRKDRCC